MTAEAHLDDGPGLPEWLIPPPQGFVAEDLDRLPGLPLHAELIDGSLVFFSPQTAFHSCSLSLFQLELGRAVPPGFRVLRRTSLILDEDQRPQPDLCVTRFDGPRDPGHAYRGHDVRLVAEVVSADSRSRDRKRKPALYAEAGIPHFWRVENDRGRPMVYVYELDPATASYVVTGIHRGRLRLAVPFEVDIDLTRIDHF
ncbi:Uma2 family endonuclease [Nonomuraea pusilla]|uniref:Uma2 family endonuclease n=1 Tax=Nonomuraea pusilla TaxID=46177 RepID=UPI003333A7F7